MGNLPEIKSILSYLIYLILSYYTIFSAVKLDLLIRVPLLDHVLALEKTTRTPRVYLILLYICSVTNSMLNRY